MYLAPKILRLKYDFFRQFGKHFQYSPLLQHCVENCSLKGRFGALFLLFSPSALKPTQKKHHDKGR